MGVTLAGSLPFGSDVSARTSILADDGNYPLLFPVLPTAGGCKTENPELGEG